MLRAAIAAGLQRAVVQRCFRFVWQEGRLPDEPAFADLLRELRLDAAALEQPTVKATLRANGEQAIADGVFGVPTAVAATAGGQRRLIWGFEALPMLVDWLHGAAVFASAEMQRATQLPTGVVRPAAR